MIRDQSSLRFGSPFCREEAEAIVLGLADCQEVRFKKYGAEWGQEGFYVRTAPGFYKCCLRAKDKPAFIGGQFSHQSLAQSARVGRTDREIAVSFAGECVRPFPHTFAIRFSVKADCPFIRRKIELIPHEDLDLGTNDLAFTLIRNREGYIHERLILGCSPFVAETQAAPRWHEPRFTQAFDKEINQDLFDMMGLPGLVAIFRGESPFCLIYLKELPPNDPLRHFVARDTPLESEVGAASTRCWLAAETPIVETSYWQLFYDPVARLEDLIPLATGAYWDMVAPYPEEKLGEPGRWMETTGKVVESLFRPKAFGTEPVSEDDPNRGWTVYTVEEQGGATQGNPGVLLQYWSDYIYRFSRLKGQEALRRQLDPLCAAALRYLRRDEPWCRDYWAAPSGKPCVSFFDMERMRCGLPLAAHWQDTDLLELYFRFMIPFLESGEQFLKGWREERDRREHSHASTDDAYYYFFPGIGWAYAAAGNFALASEVAYYGSERQATIRRAVVAMVRRLNRDVRFAEMSHYFPHNIGLLPLGWSVYANVRAYEFSGEASFLDAAVQRLHWTLTLGQFRQIPDDRQSCRPIRSGNPLDPDFRRRQENPAIETIGWFYAGAHERWHAPSEMWQMVPLLAPLLELRPDPTGLRFLALARKTLLQVFPGNCEEQPEEPLWIPFEFPLSRKCKEQYGTGPVFQAAMVFEAFANPDNGKVLAFSPTTLYGEHLTDRPRVVFHNPTSMPQSFDPRFRDYGPARLCARGAPPPEPYAGGPLNLQPGETLISEFQT